VGAAYLLRLVLVGMRLGVVHHLLKLDRPSEGLFTILLPQNFYLTQKSVPLLALIGVARVLAIASPERGVTVKIDVVAALDIAPNFRDPLIVGAFVNGQVGRDSLVCLGQHQWHLSAPLAGEHALAAEGQHRFR